MRLLLKVIFTAVLLAVLAVGALLLLVPKDGVRDQVVALVEAQTGRTLTIAGDTSFTFYPTVGVRIADVTLSNPPGIGNGPMLRMASLDIDLQLLPLLARGVEVERFVLVRPVIDLRIDRAGRPNWRFETRAASSAPVAQPTAVLAGLGPRPAMAQPALQRLRLGEVRIEEGIVTFHDERSGARHRAESVNVALGLPGLAEPLTADGDLSWRGERVAFAARLEALQALAEGAASPIGLKVDSRLLQGSFDGTVALGELAMEGALEARSPSLRDFGVWLDAGPPAGPALGALSFSGQVKASAQSISISKARLSLDGMSGQGDATLALAGPRPALRAALSLDTLDLNSLLGAAPPAREGASRPRPATDSQAGAPSPRRDQSLTDFIDELNRRDGNGGQAPREVRGWNDRAFDMGPLRALDAEVRLNAGRILYQDIKLARSAVQVTLRDALLTADLTDMQLYEGVGSGRLTLNAARPVPALAMRLDLDGVAALPLLKDAIDFDWVSGKAWITLDLSGSGRSESELVRSLKGTGSVQFADGALEGVNIPQMVRAFKAGQFTEWRRQERLQTDFSRLSGTFAMENGVARNSDLELVSPLLRVTGMGEIDLPREWIDFRFLPRVVASLEGQGGAEDLTGLTVPARLEGPFDDARLRPDLQRLMEDPELARKTAEQLGRAVERLREGDGKQVQQLLQQFLGGGEQPSSEAVQEGEPAPRQQRPADMLRQLLRR